MRHFSLTALPKLFNADDVLDDGAYLRQPQTVEDAAEVLNLLMGLVEIVERRREFLRGFSVARGELILHMRECLLHLQEGATWHHTTLRLEPPELERPA